jgi:hypothetical protein
MRTMTRLQSDPLAPLLLGWLALLAVLRLVVCLCGLTQRWPV